MIARLLVLAVCVATPALAQVRPSEPATVTQTIGGAVITIEYQRPSLRGRAPDSIFGAQVEWGAIWTPGANVVTTLATNRTILLNGTAVAAGRYGVWIEVRRDSTWLVYLHPDTTKWHLPPPPRGEMLVAIPASPRAADGVRETLAWDFERVVAGNGQLRLSWGRTMLALDVIVESSLRATVEAAAARQVEGAWIETSTRDTTRRRPFTVRYDAATRHLFATGAPGELPEHGVAVWSYMLLPRAEGIFVIGYAINNDLAQVSAPGQQTYLEFTVSNGTATSYIKRNAQDAIIANGARTP